MSGKIDCIVPYYNEGCRVLRVVEECLKTPEIRSVICVDDGSDESNSINIDWPRSSKLKRVRNKRNLGKTEAIRNGLKFVQSPNVFLLDADLIGLTSAMLSNCIEFVSKNSPDMLIIRRIKTLSLTKLLKMDILEAGERIIKTEYLKKIISLPISNYELEPAINNFFLTKKLHMVYTTLPITQYRKIDKVGIIKGFLGDLGATRQVVGFAGLRGLFDMVRKFPPPEVKV
jgi:glycosyltransferase involved in cell wall biosynthesis